MSVYCLYPDAINDDGEPATLPEGFEEFRTAPTCEHPHCIEVAAWHAQYRAEAPLRESEALARADVGDDVRRLKR